MQSETQACPARRWAAARTVGLIIILLGAQAGWNYLANPLGLYRDHRTERGRRDQRWVKAEQLAAADRDTEILILGSSRVRCLDPVEVKRLFGSKAFNCASGGGGVQDWLAFSRLAVDELHFPLRLIVIGVDAGSFVRPALRMDHPVDVSLLRPHLNHPYLTWISTRRYLWSPYQTRRSWEKLLKRLHQKASPAMIRDNDPDDDPDRDDFDYQSMLGRFNQGWRPDGFNPNFPPRSAARIIKRKRNFFRRYTRIDPHNPRDLKSILELGRRRDIEVMAFITPDPPPLRAALAKTPMEQRRAETKTILQNLSASGLIFCGLDETRFQWESFVDLDHGDTLAGRTMIEQLQACASRSAPP